MSDRKFAAFILTHGRPNSVITDRTLRRQGYSGAIYYLVDDEDKTLPEYRAKYGDSVIVFPKKQYADMTDEGDNFDNRRTTTHVRNASFDIAERLGLDYFIQLDDDYQQFKFKTNSEQQYATGKVTVRTKLDAVFAATTDYLHATPFASIAFAQGGDFIGGKNTQFARDPTAYRCRKIMNSFICSTRRRFQFVGRLNEDVNTYCVHGSRGVPFLTVSLIALEQLQPEQQAGGMTEAYKASGTYVKSFYTVMMCPSFVKVAGLNTTHARLHHQIDWKHAVPLIIPEEYASRKAITENRPNLGKE